MRFKCLLAAKMHQYRSVHATRSIVSSKYFAVKRILFCEILVKIKEPARKRDIIYSLVDKGKRAFMKAVKQKPDDDSSALMSDCLSKYSEWNNTSIK